MPNSNDLATTIELLSSRICHDIISPVGAVNNGVEFMQDMGPDAGEEAIELIAYSASQAAGKLQAFRFAYGAGGADPNIKPEDIQKAFAGLISGEGKIAQTWDPFGPLGPKKLPPAFCKMLMCTMMLGVECLPKGGSISVRPSEDKNTLVIAEGPDAGVRENVKEALAGDMPLDKLDPRLVHPYTIGVLAGKYGFKIEITTIESGKVTLTLFSPKQEEA